MAGRKEDRIHSSTKFLKSEYLYIVSFLFKKKNEKENTGDKMIAIQMSTSGTGEHLSGRLCSESAKLGLHPQRHEKATFRTLGHWVEGAGREEHL